MQRRLGVEVAQKLGDIDNIVLDIVGRESPSITSLGVTETWPVGEPKGKEDSTMSNNLVAAVPWPNTSTPSSSNNEPKRKRESDEVTPQRAKKLREERLELLKEEKLELTIEHLRLSNKKIEVETYNAQLQAIAWERELNLQPSHITVPFFEQDVSAGEEEDVSSFTEC